MSFFKRLKAIAEELLTDDSYTVTGTQKYTQTLGESPLTGAKPMHNSNQLLAKEKEVLTKTVFLYSQNNKSVRPNQMYPSYMLYRYNVVDPHSYHIQMINEGYFETADSITLLKALKVTDLKEMLKEKGLKTSGKKEDLILRLLDNVDKAYIDSFFKGDRQIFTISEKGNQWLNQNKIYIDFHNKSDRWNISFEDFVKFKHEIPFKGNFNDIAWALFNERKTLHETYSDYDHIGDLRNNLLHMSELLEEENHIENSIQYLMYVFWMDISGAVELGKRRYYSESELREKLHANPGYTFLFAPGILRRIIGSKEFIIKHEVDPRCLSTTTVRLCCSYELFRSIVYDLCSNALFSKEKYYNALIDDFISRK